MFFDASWPRRLLARVRAVVSTEQCPGAATVRTPRPRSSFPGWGAAVAGRLPAGPDRRAAACHLYSGNVSWHEQGMRFSWRVMAREKNGSVTFVVRDPVNGREWLVHPRSI